MAALKNITRPDKGKIALKIHENLVNRAASGPAEPGLDGYIDDLADIAARLGVHVIGRDAALHAREARLERLDEADTNVCTWLRHIESFLSIEANKSRGPHVGKSKAAHAAACPDGLVPINSRTVDRNACCRTMLRALQSPEHAPAVAAIEMPASWLVQFDAALTESEAAIDAVIAARDDKVTHVHLGQDVESAWVKLMTRLRRYVSSRADSDDAEKLDENRLLLSPLLAALQKLRADAAARATRRATAEGAPQNPTPNPAPKPTPDPGPDPAPTPAPASEGASPQ